MPRECTCPPDERPALCQHLYALSECLAKAGYGDPVNHPAHYGGANNPYETIKVIEAWDLPWHLGDCVKYISRAGKKGDLLEDLKKAQFYLNRYIEMLEKRQSTKTDSSKSIAMQGRAEDN